MEQESHGGNTAVPMLCVFGERMCHRGATQLHMGVCGSERLEKAIGLVSFTYALVQLLGGWLHDHLTPGWFLVLSRPPIFE